jgi:hypothetical protein
MASATQVGRTKARKARPAPVRIPSGLGRQTGAGIDPKLKAFIDRVVVPILVRDFLADPGSEKNVAKSRPDMASCGVAPSAAEVD